MPLDPEALADVVVQTIDTALSPVLERLAAAETRLSTLGDLRDRVVTVETKAALPVVPDLREVRERLVALETRTALPDPVVTHLADRVAVVERLLQDDTHAHDIADLRERMAVLETRAPVPGPPGKDGADGKDGLGFEDLAVDFDGERTLALKFARDGVSKVFPVELPYLKYQGVYSPGQSYVAGDVVTWAGSTWVAKEATSTKPGDVIGAAHWVLCVKKGRDGRDGKDAPGALPVVAVGKRG